mgnify:CR=1 FL=1
MDSSNISSASSIQHHEGNVDDDSLLAAAENNHEPSYETPRSSEDGQSIEERKNTGQDS